MPLAFESLDGTVTFGFFNIASDMLLMENRFFFADAFCDLVSRVARSGDAVLETPWPVLIIERPDHIGDLMGAIHGLRYTGFIGETYRRYPFPEREEEFRQRPEGFETQAEFLEMIAPFAREQVDAFRSDPGTLRIEFGDVRFDRAGFQALVGYVWRGGYPRWRDEERPGFVLEMRAAIESGCGSLLRGMSFPSA